MESVPHGKPRPATDGKKKMKIKLIVTMVLFRWINVLFQRIKRNKTEKKHKKDKKKDGIIRSHTCRYKSSSVIIISWEGMK